MFLLVPAYPGCPGSKAVKRSLFLSISYRILRTVRLTDVLLRPRQGSGVMRRVCLSVCLRVRDHIFGTTRPIFTKFFMNVTNGRGSVLLWRRNDTLCTSGFTHDVMFAHKPGFLDVAVQLKRRNTQPWAWL